MGIQINGNTNNINAGIGSLSIEDINELDIIGVATAANFKTGVSDLHSVGLTLSGGQIDVGSNIKIGTAGVVTATSFVGSGANLTNLPSQVTINNATANRVLTSDGGTTLNGEANLTFNGGQLFTQTTGNQDPLVVNSTYANKKLIIRETSDANSNGGIRIQKKHSSLHPANYWYGDIAFQGWDGDEYRRAGLIECVADGTPADNNMPGMLRFSTNSGTTSQTERFRITASGQLRLMEGNNVKMSVYNDGSQNFITSNTGQEIKISCGNGDSNGIEFWDYTGGNKRCQIDGHGIKFNTDTAEANALDDYEEGSWTPDITGRTGGTVSIQVGRYTKVGRIVSCQCHLNISNLTSSDAYFKVNGLPFTSANIGNNYSVTSSVHFNNSFSIGGDRGMFNGLLGANINHIAFYAKNGASIFAVPSADFVSGNILFEITYMAT